MIRLIQPAKGDLTAALQEYPVADLLAEPHEALDAEEAAAAPIRWDALERVDEDRSFPKPVHFAWEADRACPEGGCYDLAIADNPRFHDCRLLHDLDEPEVDVWNLCIGTQYYWKVMVRSPDGEVEESAVSRFRTNPAPPRWLYVPGITNVRDIGGWPLPGNWEIKQGLIYRSSELEGHVGLEDEGRRVLEDELGIRTDLDLRGPDENPRPVLDPRKVTWVNIPTMPYEFIVEDVHRDAYRRAFSLFADVSRYPILFHCWGGVDRGGTMAFLLGAIIGMSMEDLMLDYELSSLSVWGARSRFSAEFTGMLEGLARFGGTGHNLAEMAENYLLSSGVTVRELETIREQLTG